MIKKFIILFGTLIFIPSVSYSGFIADIETGVVKSYYNDVRIPGDTGTELSPTDELEDRREFFYRLRGSFSMGKHLVSALYAPLNVESKGTLSRNIDFGDKTFIAGNEIKSTFKFNSYRLTYRYELFNSNNLAFGGGFTAKIRDAYIRLENDSTRAEKKNIGFVPIINFALQWDPVKTISFMLEGDALFAPQGRAEDVSISIMYHAGDSISIRGGYRVLEGGADNEEVYTFSLFNYALVGLTYRF